MEKKPRDRSILNHLKILPTFNGNDNEDAVQWLYDITDGLNYVKFTDDQKVSTVADYLGGDVRRWLLENISVLDSWSTFIQEFKKEFWPNSLKDDAIPEVNLKNQMCELLEEQDVNLDFFSITLVESNTSVSFTTCIMENSENNCAMIWPEGHESWFIHDVLPQRSQFCRSEQQETMLFNSPSNINIDFTQETLLNCTNIFPLSVINDTYNAYNIDVSNNMLKLHAIYNNVISFFLSFEKSPLIINICHRPFIAATIDSYFCHNCMPYDTADRNWFRRLAVP